MTQHLSENVNRLLLKLAASKITIISRKEVQSLIEDDKYLIINAVSFQQARELRQE